MTSDAYHITAPPDTGAGAVNCMEKALHDAGVNKLDIGYINAHATSTFADTIETRVIKTVFGQARLSTACEFNEVHDRTLTGCSWRD